MTLFNNTGTERVANGEIKGKPYYIYREKCHRCGGAGGWSGWPGFTCYRCGGCGKEMEPTRERLYDADELVKVQARAAAAAAKRAEKKAAIIAARDAVFQQAGDTARSLADQHGTQQAIELVQSTTADSKVLANLYRIAAAERTAAFEAAKQAQRDNSQHVGNVGERIELVLTVGKVLRFESQNYGWPATYINLCKDASGNAVVYKGSNGWAEGETIVVKATVKEHGERDGVKQTIIQRPKVSAVVSA